MTKTFAHRQLGQGTIVEQTDDSVDYTFVGARFDATNINGQPLSWPQFIGMIPGAKEDGQAMDATINSSVMPMSPKKQRGAAAAAKGAKRKRAVKQPPPAQDE